MPYLTGERCPHPDPLARGAWIGLTRRHGRAEMVRSLLEGVTFGMADMLAILRDQMQVPVKQIRASGAEAVLIAMRIPSNYGPAYTEKFHSMYAELGKAHDVAVIDGFMDAVALDDKLMQADGIHPNAQAQPVLLDVIWPALSRQLKK